MKRLLILFFFFSSIIASWGQTTIKQEGVVYQYNGSNPRTPLGNVYIKVSTSPNAVLSDSQSGKFVILFHGLSFGAHIGKVMVQKRGMIIFNQQVVDEWNIRKEPLRLILCDADEFEKQKQKLISIGQREAKKRYEKRIAEIESKYKKESSEWYQKLSEADEELQNVRKHIAEYADLFARIDESEVDTLAQKAIGLFNEGRIEEAVQMFEEGHYMDKLRMANRAINQGEKLMSIVAREIENAEKEKALYVQSIKAQIEAYKLQSDYAKARDLLKSLADELKTLEGYDDYAWYCKNQNYFSEAEKYYLKMLDVVDSYTTDENLPVFSSIYHSLGELYMDTQEYDKSEEYLEKALNYRRELTLTNPVVFSQKLAYTLNDLGLVYVNTKKSEMAEKCFLEALAIKRKNHDVDSLQYSIDMAKTLNNLGNLYIRDYKYKNGDSLLNEALFMLRKHAADSEDYYKILSLTYHSLGLLYDNMELSEKSEENYLEALKIKEKMAIKNPDAYNPMYAITLTNTAIMYCKKEDYDMGEKMFVKVKDIYEELARYNPKAYETSLSRTYGNLGILYSKTKRYEESERMYKKNLEISKRRYKMNPIAYGRSYANMLGNIASLYDEIGRADSQLIALKESYEIFKMLTDQNPQRNERDFVDIVVELGKIMFSQKAYRESEAYYSEAIPILRRLIESNPEKYRSRLSSSLLLLSAANIYNKRYKDSEVHAKEGLEIDPAENYHYTNLAASILFQGRYEEAESIYRQYKRELKDEFLSDFEQFSEEGSVPNESEVYVDQIKNMLKE